MADAGLARRTRLQLTFKNVDVPEDINLHLATASYTDNEEDGADDFQITYEDRERNLLGKWIDVSPQFVTSPQEVKQETTPANVINYVVKRGDTLSAIAAKYLGAASKYPQIAQENNIKNPDLIYPGQVFKITTGGETKTTTTPAQQTKGAELRLVSAVLVQENWNDSGDEATLNIGTFEIDSVDMSGPPTKVTVKGTSIPYTSKLRMEKKSRAWEKITLKDIGTQIAQESGMQLMYEAEYNPTYKRKEQVLTSDIVFLQKLCKAAGMALKVTEMTVVIYDAEVYDSKQPIKTIKLGDADILSYKMGVSLNDTAYTSCHLSYSDPDSKNTIEYTYTPNTSIGTGQVLEINEKVNSTEEAVALTKKRLREKNTQQYTASVKLVGDVTLVAGATVELKGFQQFDRKYKITQAVHNLTGGYTVDLTLKQVLEGY